MKKHKRMIGILLSAVMIICMMPVMSMAETFPKDHCNCVYINSKGDIISEPMEGDYCITINSWYEEDVSEEHPVYVLDDASQTLSLVFFRQERIGPYRFRPENGSILVSQYRRSETGKLKWIDGYDQDIENIISNHLSYSWQYYNKKNHEFINIPGENQSSYKVSTEYIAGEDEGCLIKVIMKYDGTYVDDFVFVVDNYLGVEASIEGNCCIEKGQKVTLTANATTNAPNPKAVKYSYSWTTDLRVGDSWYVDELGTEPSITVDTMKCTSVELTVTAEYENYRNYSYETITLLPYENLGMLTEQQGVSFTEKNCVDTNNIKCITFRPEQAGVYEFIYGSPYTWICDVFDSNNEQTYYYDGGYYDATNHSREIVKLKENETYKVIVMCEEENFSSEWTDTITVKKLSECNHIRIATNDSGSVDKTSISDVAPDTIVTTDGNKLTIGENVVTATPNTGYAFSRWESDDVTISNNSFRMPNKDIVVKAVFELVASAEQNVWTPAENITKTYGEQGITINFTNMSADGGELSYSSSNTDVATVTAGLTGCAVKIVGAGETNITATAAAVPEKYAETRVSVKLIINPAPLTIKAKDIGIIYGDELPGLEYIVSGFVLGEKAENVLSGTPEYQCNYHKYDNAGSYQITVSGLDARNYTISYQPGTLTVDKLADYSIFFNENTLVQSINHTTPVLASTVPQDSTAQILVEYYVNESWTDVLPDTTGTYAVRAHLVSSDNLVVPQSPEYTEETLTIRGGAFIGSDDVVIDITEKEDGSVEIGELEPGQIQTILEDAGNNDKNLTLDLTGSGIGSGSTGLTIPASLVDAINESTNVESFTVKLNDAEINMDSNVLSTLANNLENGSKLTVQMETVNQDALNDNQKNALNSIGGGDNIVILDLKMIATQYDNSGEQTGSKEIHQLNGISSVKVAYDYEETDGKILVAIYVDEDGQTTYLPVIYNEGFVSFRTDHFSLYALTEIDKANCIHSWDAGRVTLQPTNTTNGIMTYTCLICGNTRNETIPAMGRKDSGSNTALLAAAGVGIVGGLVAIIASVFGDNNKPNKNHQHAWDTTYTVDKKATTTSEGSMSIHCNGCNETKDVHTIPVADLKLKESEFTYDGTAHEPEIVSKNLTEGKDYTVHYSEEKSVGTHVVTVKLCGDKYEGELMLSYTINPKAVSLTKLTAGKKSFSAKWKKLKSQTDGYQIRYSNNSDMNKSKTVSIAENTTTSKIIKKLKSSKKYYVQIRSYKTVGDTTYYSAWSKTKSIKTR